MLQWLANSCVVLSLPVFVANAILHSNSPFQPTNVLTAEDLHWVRRTQRRIGV